MENPLITDLQTPNAPAVFDADICIIGGGAAGISLALDLQGHGLGVCLLEGGGLTEDTESHALYEGKAVGHPMEPADGRYRGLGGSTSRWTGCSAPLSSIDFEERPWVHSSGWPITREELSPYYRQAWDLCAVRDVMRPDEAVLADLGEDRLALDPKALDPFIWRYPSRTDFPRKYFSWAFAGPLRTSQDVQVLLHANICGFEAEGDGASITAVVVKTLTGVTARVRARAFVLSCGGLENARILLNSASTVPGGLGNAHDLVGRYFMQHLRGDSGTVEATPEQAAVLQNSFNYFPARNGTRYEVGFSLPEQVQRDEKLLNASAVLAYEPSEHSSWIATKTILQDLRSRVPTLATARAARNLARHPREAVVSSWRRLQGRPAHLLSSVIRVNQDLEQMPNPDSRVTLTDEVDALGLRRLRVDWRVDPIEVATARRLTEAVGAELKRLGLGTVHIDPSLLSGGMPPETMLRTHHHIGTTRMAADPRHGVVDADCRVHGTDNLFVAGSSVFPTGGHANPTLTIVALAVRLGEHLRQSLAKPQAATVRQVA